MLFSQYEFVQKIGSGTFGSVSKYRDVFSGEEVAVKKFSHPYFTEQEALEQREIQVLKIFNHPNIVKAKRIQLVDDKLYIVFECSDMNLTQFMRMRSQQFSEHHRNP